MGNIKSSLKGDRYSISSTTRAIDKQLRDEQKQKKKELKLLLLGAGESGKSTVIKQMRLIHASGFKASEREGFRIIVFLNVFSAMQILLEAVDILNLKLTDSILKYAHIFKGTPSLEENQRFPEIYYLPLKELWNDSSIQAAYQKGNAFALHDNIAYFYNQLDTLWNPNYKPSDGDIIRCRAKTTGISETAFHLGGLTYRMFDVGGQRSERKKWIHCFDNVTAILFVVAISGYDQCLIEDRASNQMHEALMLFDTICNSYWFINTSMLLLLNKIDIFKKKINDSPIEAYFPDYQGTDLDAAKNYFKQRFQRLNRNPDKRIYVHFTDATDTTLLQNVMIAVSDIVVNENLNRIMIV